MSATATAVNPLTGRLSRPRRRGSTRCSVRSAAMPRPGPLLNPTPRTEAVPTIRNEDLFLSAGSPRWSHQSLSPGPVPMLLTGRGAGVPFSEPWVTGGQIAGKLPVVLPVQSPARPGRLGRDWHPARVRPGRASLGVGVRPGAGGRCPPRVAALAHVRRPDGEAQCVDPG